MGETTRLECSQDLVVIRDGEDVELPSRRADEHVGPLGSVAPGRVDVQISASSGERSPPPSPRDGLNPWSGAEAFGRRGMRDHLRPACPTTVYDSARDPFTFA